MTKTFSQGEAAHRGTRGRPAFREHDLDWTQVEELLLQALETELGGVQVYQAAIECAVEEDLREEWQEYLEQTRRHVDIVTRLCNVRGIDTERETPGRAAVRQVGETFVEAMRHAREAGEPAAAQLVAAECVVLAETKDHANWELLAAIAKSAGREDGEPFQEAVDEVEDEEDEHLYHTMGWARELWLQSFGLPAKIPPPEEQRDVRTAIGAARVRRERKGSLSGRSGRSGKSSKSGKSGKSSKRTGNRRGGNRGRGARTAKTAKSTRRRSR